MARFDFEELLMKEKEELDKIKTALEIYQSEDKYAFERKKFQTENIRFVGIAILTAVISLGSSYFIESFKQENNNLEGVRKEFVDLKKNYLTEKDKSKQKELACALATFDNSIKDKSIELAQLNFDKVCNSVSDIQEQVQIISKTDTSSEVVKEALNKLKNFDKQLQELKQQKNSVPATEQPKIIRQIAEVNSRINTVVNATPEIKQAVESTANIEKSMKQIETVNNAIMQQTPNKAGAKSSVTWFKEGYFLQFGEYRVLLQYLDKNLGIQVEICRTQSAGLCDKPMLTKAWVKFDSPLQFSDDDHSYRINLEAIDHAGKNPFTLAAYITFETLSGQL